MGEVGVPVTRRTPHGRGEGRRESNENGTVTRALAGNSCKWFYCKRKDEQERPRESPSREGCFLGLQLEKLQLIYKLCKGLCRKEEWMVPEI